jgi:ABC-type uncharacterized transport system involved in gliding motility auxiliary subunit
LTSPASWGETDFSERPARFDPSRDQPGPHALAAAVEGELNIRLRGRDDHSNRKARIVVFGDSDFAANGSFNFSGNGDLFLNTVTWLAQEKGPISIRPKETRFTPLFLSQSQGKVLMYVSLLFLPAAVFITGIVIWKRRRRL